MEHVNGTITSGNPGVEKPANQTPDRFWFRVHNEVLNDMVFIAMSDADLGAYVRLLALANSTRSVGIIHADVAGIAGALRMSEEAAESLLLRLERAELVVRDDGMVAILDERHYEGKGLAPSQSRAAQNDRQRKRRARLKAEAACQYDVSDGCHSDMSRHIEENSHSIGQSENSTDENRTKSNSHIDQAFSEEVPLLGDSLDGHIVLEGDDDDVLL